MNLRASPPPLKWPRSLEAHPRLAELESLLKSKNRPLWEHGEIDVARVGVTDSLRKTLSTLHGRGQVERGLENITAILTSEKNGQEALHEKQGTLPAYRVSRILLIAPTGSERFNRDCDRLLRNHAERLMGLALDESGAGLFEELFGSDATAKALLISHKDAVAQTLLALLGD